jgi:hypothetical protein
MYPVDEPRVSALQRGAAVAAYAGRLALARLERFPRGEGRVDEAYEHTVSSVWTSQGVSPDNAGRVRSSAVSCAHPSGLHSSAPTRSEPSIVACAGARQHCDAAARGPPQRV